MEQSFAGRQVTTVKIHELDFIITVKCSLIIERLPHAINLTSTKPINAWVML